MIYFIYGEDLKKARGKMHEILQTLSNKRPNSEIFKINSENWNVGNFEELISSQGLFEKKYIVLLDNLFEKKEAGDFISKNISEMKLSDHWFLILEGKIDKKNIDKISKFSYKTQQFIEQNKKNDYSEVFGVSDKLFYRNKKDLWVGLMDLFSKNVSAEEIHGIFFWAVKNMMIVSQSGGQKNSGLTSFQYNKAISGSKNYRVEELKKMITDLVSITHKVRSGGGDLDIMLEKWVLKV